MYTYPLNDHFQIVATCMQRSTKECASGLSTSLVNMYNVTLVLSVCPSITGFCQPYRKLSCPKAFSPSHRAAWRLPAEYCGKYILA